jgi:nitrogen fixation NifU-like protein
MKRWLLLKRSRKFYDDFFANDPPIQVMHEMKEIKNLRYNNPMEKNLNQEIIEHLMHPKNYGPLENPTGVGVGHSEQTGEFVIFYLRSNNDLIESVSYATNGCQDTVVFGSMFTQMIQGETFEYAHDAAQKLDQKVREGSPKQQACATMVLKAFEAAKIHEDRQNQGFEEELHTIEIGMDCEVEA